MPADITKSSKSPDVQIMKQGHTSNNAFGSNPNAKVKGGRPVRDLGVGTSKR